MTEQDIHRILLAPVSEVRQATDKEAEAFADKPDGCLYVLGLRTGQRFLTHISKQSEEYTLRPMDGAMSNLKEINWKKKERSSFHGLDTTIKCAEGTPAREYNAYMYALEPILDAKDAGSPFWMYCFKYNPLYKKAFEIRRVQSERFSVATKIPCTLIKGYRQGRGNG